MIPRPTGNRIIHINVTGENTRTKQLVTRKVQRHSDATAIQNYIQLIRVENKQIEHYLPLPSLQVGVDHSRVAMLNRDIVYAFRRAYTMSSCLYLLSAVLDVCVLPQLFTCASQRSFCKDIYIAFTHQIPYISINWLYSSSDAPVLVESSNVFALPNVKLDTSVIIGTMLGENSPLMYLLTTYTPIPGILLTAAATTFKREIKIDMKKEEEPESAGLNMSDIPTVSSSYVRFFNSIADLIYRFGATMSGNSVRIVSDTSTEVTHSKPLLRQAPSTATPLPATGPLPTATPSDTAASPREEKPPSQEAYALEV